MARMRFLSALLAFVATCSIAATAEADVIISTHCSLGSQPGCPRGPASTTPDGVLTYHPAGENILIIDSDGVLNAGWILVPASASLILSAQANAEIRAIGLPSAFLTAPARVITPELDLGFIQPGSIVDFEAIFGRGVSSVQLSDIDLTPNHGLTLLVRMRSFDLSSYGATVSVTPVPEPASAALVGAGLFALAMARFFGAPKGRCITRHWN